MYFVWYCYAGQTKMYCSTYLECMISFKRMLCSREKPEDKVGFYWQRKFYLIVLVFVWVFVQSRERTWPTCCSPAVSWGVLEFTLAPSTSVWKGNLWIRMIPAPPQILDQSDLYVYTVYVCIMWYVCVTSISKAWNFPGVFQVNCNYYYPSHVQQEVTVTPATWIQYTHWICQTCGSISKLAILLETWLYKLIISDDQ